MLSNLFIFGDSISDGGNVTNLGNPPTGTAVNLPYVTNGIPYSVLLCNYLGIAHAPRVSPGSVLNGPRINDSYISTLPYGNNYSTSGAHITGVAPNLGPFITVLGNSQENQIQLFLQDYNGTAPANSGAVMFIGTNDFQAEDIPTCMIQIQSQINRLLAASIPNVIVINYPIRNGINGLTGSNLTSALLWNASIATMIANTPGAVLFDINALWQNIINSPQSFGISNYDTNIADNGTVVGFADDYLYWSAWTHYSGAGHRIIAQAMMPLLQSTFLKLNTPGDASHSAIATRIMGNIAPNPIVPLGYTQNQQLVTQNDHRLWYGQQAVVTPQMGIRWYSDFESATTIPAPYTWLQTKTGLGGYTYSSGTANTHGCNNIFVNTAADVTGQTIPSPFIMAPTNGKLDMSFRAGAWTLNSGDNITVIWGLVDSISAPTNGMFFSINNNAGTITATFTARKASADTTIPFTFPTTPPATIRFISDFRWNRGTVYVGNVQVATSTVLFVPPNSAFIYPGFVTTKTSGTAGNSFLPLDMFNITYFWDRS
jgi:phospholipase/lecithinase/hemolysin